MPGRGVCCRLAAVLVLWGLGGPGAGATEPVPPETPAQETPAPESSGPESSGPESSGPETPGPAGARAVPYRVEFEGGLMRGRQGALLEESSQLLALRDRPPASLGGLERRADGDRERLATVLRSQGYYDGTVDYRIDETVDPVLVTLIVNRGTPYLLEQYEIVYRGDAPTEGLPHTPEDVGVELGRRARASVIVEAQARLITLLEERGHPLAEIVRSRNVIDREARTMKSRVVVDAGPRVGFGPLSIHGLEDTDEAYIRRIRPWQRGETYDRRLVDEYRQDLIDTRLFTAVAIVPARTPDGDGNLPLDITLVEREFRSIGGGLSWGTDEGFELSAFWEHRNLDRRNESLRLETRVGEIEQSLNAFFRKPRFRRRDQTLLADARLKRLETDAYKETSIAGAIGLEREFGPLWDGKLGVSLELTDITENRDDTSLLLFGLPGSLIRDSRDDDFDATRGTRLDMGVTPYMATGDDTFPFFVTAVGGSVYHSVVESDRVVLAGRARVGSILGASRAQIPATKRFYAGGGGSIRGYQYQKVGPLDDENDPLGGRSLLEVSGEVRLRLTERFGIVPFIDGGTVFVEPDFRSDEDDTIRWSAGLGLRFYTPIGPLRLDLAFPLNGRKDIDNDFEFYVSIGQAF
jgi:translocation and assembly module TamA